MPCHRQLRAPCGWVYACIGTDAPVHLIPSNNPFMPNLNLRLRLSLMISALLLLAAAMGGVFIIDQARDNIRTEVRSTMALTGHFLDAELDNLRDRRGLSFDPDQPPFHLNRLRQIRHLEISYYDQAGRLMEVSATAPLQSRAPAWFVWLVGVASKAMPDAHRKIDLNGMALGTLVMHPDPAFEIEKMWQLSRGLLGLLLVFFVLINLLVWWAVSRALRPMGRLLEALNEVEQGNLSARLPEFTLPEILRLSAGFNHMTARLERSMLENRRLTRRMIELQEQERRHLARELHDEIGQCITAIHADAVTIRDQEDSQRPVVRESAEAIVEVAGRIKTMVRSMLQRLRPATLDRLGLKPALRELVGGFRHRYPQTNCELQVDEQLPDPGEELSITLYRVVQECLTNIARHAHAASVKIELRYLADADSIELKVSDDGCGFNAHSQPRGFGLQGMRERVLALGGFYKLDSQLGQGTRVQVRLPAQIVGESSA